MDHMIIKQKKIYIKGDNYRIKITNPKIDGEGYSV